jgi:hypothetical protein
MSFLVPTDVEGRRILAFAWRATVLFSVTAIVAAIWTTLFLRVVAVTVALLLFAAGMIIFLVAYLRAIGRSRYEVISVAGVYLMTGGVAPATVRRSLYGALAVQTVVALATASARPYSSLAFGVLVPLLGLALCGLWSAVCGTFPPRPDAGSVPATAGDAIDAGAGEPDDEEPG